MTEIVIGKFVEDAWKIKQLYYRRIRLGTPLPGHRSSTILSEFLVRMNGVLV